jgi:hypothetical protein
LPLCCSPLMQKHCSSDRLASLNCIVRADESAAADLSDTCLLGALVPTSDGGGALQLRLSSYKHIQKMQQQQLNMAVLPPTDKEY